MKRVYLVSVSGGKDSAVTWAWMEKHYANKGEIVPYFADTGWEHPLTYDYLDYLEEFFGKKIRRIKSEQYVGFEDMCIKKKMIPNRVKRFCTQKLKLLPSQAFIKSWFAKGYTVVNVTGVRRDESAKRSGEQRWKFSFFSGASDVTKTNIKNGIGCIVFQPIVYWSVHDVYAYADQVGVKLNPLYYMGFSRVGCYPCINANVGEIGLLDAERVQRIKELEDAVSDASGKKVVFWHQSGTPVSIEKHQKKYAYNTLGLDLGCINHLGKCE